MSTSGTYTISDLLVIGNVNAYEVGEDRIVEVLNRDLAIFNQRVTEMLSQLAVPISAKIDRLARQGTSIEGDMVELDEFGQPPAQKVSAGQNVGFPMRKYGFAVGWTRDYILNATVADIALGTSNSQKAYLRRLHATMRSHIFTSSNYTFVDRFVDELSLPVKKFVNADSATIPNGPNGETFDGATHTHYLAASVIWSSGSASTFDTDLKALVDTVVEHGHVQDVRIYINKAQEANVRLATDFEKYVDPRITFRATDTATRTLDLSNSGNRAIGIIGEAEVWVKPWIPANYMFCFALGGPKPLKFRQHHVTSIRGLRIGFEMDDYPLRARLMEAYWGFGTWERTNGAVLHTGSSTWIDATITS